MFENLLNKLYDYIGVIVCQYNYKKKLKELKKKNTPVRVAFLVRELEKWNYQPLYDELKQNSKFKPFILIAPLISSHKGLDKTRISLDNMFDFFKEKNTDVYFAYKNNNYIHLKNFSPDVVFYDSPWELYKKYRPEYISFFALTCYSPYGAEILDNKNDYTIKFHKKLFKLFVGDEYNFGRYEQYKKGNTKNCTITGYPKFDVYKSIEIKNNEKIKIIYAPHHSFEKEGLHFATFDKNAKFILELAKKYKNSISWVFKPHPRLKYSLIKNNIMKKSEIENYFNEWEKIGEVYKKGDYFDLFKTSNLMITDCCSFLAEYLPVNKPLIRLKNEQNIPFNKLGKKIVNVYYEVSNNEELEKMFMELVEYKHDFKKELREKLIKEIFNFNESSSKKIINELLIHIKQE